eukprot:TRINITY_DN11979_c1_g12_i2.p2 TRINITY_DN11979_c1_g12~~TRINITY_DN11979_c1_g12_i2.p2  ORF type:complete len:393 (+),score=22.78 TRINITY_DN11979_c1_g12_i2:3090-4268(+)
MTKDESVRDYGSPNLKGAEGDFHTCFQPRQSIVTMMASMRPSLVGVLYLVALCIQFSAATPNVRNKLLLPGLHSGLGNQAIGFLSAIKFAQLTNRAFVLPPVLTHFHVAFGPRITDQEQCIKHSLEVFERIQTKYEAIVAVEDHLRWTDIFDLSNIGVPTIDLKYAQSVQNVSVVAHCGTNPSGDELRRLMPDDKDVIAIASAFYWRFTDAKLAIWPFPLARQWSVMIRYWLSSNLLDQRPIHGFHLRVCDPIAKRWHRGERTAASEDLARTNISAALQDSLASMAGKSVYFASDLTPGACNWSTLKELSRTLNFTCIDSEQLLLDDLTQAYAAQGHDWLPDFVTLVHAQGELKTVAMSHDCQYAINVKPASSFARLLKATQKQNRLRSDLH